MEKQILSFKQFLDYCDISESKGRKAISKKELPYYKPQNSKIYFKLEDVKAWLLRNKVEANTAA